MNLQKKGPLLIIFGGLPAVGKTSVAKALAQKAGACHLRIDTIEQTLINTDLCTTKSIEEKGYLLAAEVAKDNLRNGLSVIADCVNPLEAARQMWRDAAAAASSPVWEIEFYCSDATLHRKRAESRPCDIPRFVLPVWEDILNREYEPWPSPTLRLDTAILSIEESVQRIIASLEDQTRSTLIP